MLDDEPAPRPCALWILFAFVAGFAWGAAAALVLVYIAIRIAAGSE